MITPCHSVWPFGHARREWCGVGGNCNWRFGFNPLLILCLFFCICFAASGQEKPLQPRVKFDIPAQQLVTALQAYSAASGVQVLYESSLIAGRSSSPVRGEFTRETALEYLLKGQDLIVRYSRADAITLVDPLAPSVDEPPAEVAGDVDLDLGTIYMGPAEATVDRSALARYVGAIQLDVQSALRKTAETRAGSYRVGIDLWVEPSRRVKQTEIFQSTGNASRDVAVIRALDGLVLREAAPAHVQQPVRVMISVKAM
jgi:hypothetical protein